GVIAYWLVTPPEIPGGLSRRVQQYTDISPPIAMVPMVPPQWRGELENPIPNLQVVADQVVGSGHPTTLRYREHIPVEHALVHGRRMKTSLEPRQVDRDEPSVVVMDRPRRLSAEKKLPLVAIRRLRTEP